MLPDDDSPNSGGGTGTWHVEQCIDAVDWLRKYMRNHGMVDSAGALDDAFAKCLKAYLDLKDRDEGVPKVTKMN